MKRFIVLFSIIITLGALGTAVWVYFAFFTPSAQAKSLAQRTMQSAYDGDKAALADSGEPATRDAFVSSVATRNYRFESFEASDGSYYSLFSFTDNNSPKKARIAVKNLKVVMLSAQDNLAAIPKNDGALAAASGNDESACLSAKDLRYLDTSNLYAKTFRGATMFFDGDTLDYNGTADADTLLNRIAEFYKATTTKDYKITIAGYAPDPTSFARQYASQRNLAQNRGVKLQDDLVSRGVARDRISLSDPAIYSSSPPNFQDHYMNIDIQNLCVDK